ncbi:MAG: SAM-dependent methyltransferase [Rhodopirellula sp. TMED11]|nr:MAG: SAM-dependent methyltransferase [Rhodopirellula sp. TMED11]
MSEASWYDYPQYFDMLFRDETASEVEFFQQAFERYGNGPIKRLFEPGCGTGRLVIAMAALGYDATGLDLSDPMLSYMKQRLKRRGLTATAINGDMADFHFDAPFDAAFCTFNTFRHLLTEQQALAHLNCVADCLNDQGLYVLGMHLDPEEEYDPVVERFTSRSNGTVLKTVISVPQSDLKRRQETLRIKLNAVQRSGKKVRIVSEFPLRLYTAKQLKRLLKKASDRFELVETFDFGYDIDDPQPFDSELLEALLVLRKIG